MDPKWSRNASYQQERQRADDKKRKFPWIDCWKFEKGEFDVRMISHPSMLPNGVHVYCVHKVMTSFDEGAIPTNILCTRSYHETRIDNNGEFIVPQSCFICDLYADYVERDLLEKMANKQPECREAFTKMSRFECDTYIFPVAVRCRIKKTVSDNGSERIEVHPDKHNVELILLAVKEKDANLLEQLFNIREKVKNIHSQERGCWFQLEHRGGQNGWKAHSPSKRAPIADSLSGMQLDHIGKEFPNVRMYGQQEKPIPGRPTRNFRKSYIAQVTIVKKSDFGGILTQSKAFRCDWDEFHDEMEDDDDELEDDDDDLEDEEDDEEEDEEEEEVRRPAKSKKVRSLM